MNQQDELARRIVAQLEEGTQRITPAARERLTAARHAALAQYRPASEWVPTAAGHGVAGYRFFGLRYLMPIAALVVGLAGVVYMHSNGSSGDIADIDAGLLTDELPINAYLDKGFDSWLKRSSR